MWREASRSGRFAALVERPMTTHAALTVALAGLLASSAAPAVQHVNIKVPPYDVIIKNGTIYDGSGDAPYVGDVGISGDRIVYVGAKKLTWPARRTIDATGKAVSP